VEACSAENGIGLVKLMGRYSGKFSHMFSIQSLAVFSACYFSYISIGFLKANVRFTQIEVKTSRYSAHLVARYC
jgi:6-phosphofructokinase